MNRHAAHVPVCKRCGRRLWTATAEQRAVQLCHNCQPQPDRRLADIVHAMRCKARARPRDRSGRL